MLTRIPPTFVKANFTGLPSCRSFAKGIAVNASNPMIAADKVKYSGCCCISNKVAKGFLKTIMSKDRNTVDMIRDMLVLLYTCCLSALLQIEKKLSPFHKYIPHS